MSANQRQKVSPAIPLSLGALVMEVANTDTQHTRDTERILNKRDAESDRKDEKAPMTKPDSSARGPSIGGRLPPPSHRLGGLAITHTAGTSLYQQFHQQQQALSLRNAQQEEGYREATHRKSSDEKSEENRDLGKHNEDAKRGEVSVHSSLPQYGRRANRDSSADQRAHSEGRTRDTHSQNGTGINHELMNGSDARHYLLHRKQQGKDRDVEDASDEVARTSEAFPNPSPSTRPTYTFSQSEHLDNQVQALPPSVASASHGRRSAGPALSKKVGAADEATIGGNPRRQGQRAEENKEMDEKQNCIKDQGLHTAGRHDLNRDDEMRHELRTDIEQQGPHLPKSGSSMPPPLLPPTGTQRVAAIYLWQCQECFHACNVMKSENRCICGHRFKEHGVRPAMEAVISRRTCGGNLTNTPNPKCPCTVSKCPCKDFFYMVAEGAWIVRCRCKHKHVEHDPNPPYLCTKCQKVPAPSIKSHAVQKCCGFESPFVCNCDHPWSSHAQVWELRELSALPQVLDEFGDPSVVKRGL